MTSNEKNYEILEFIDDDSDEWDVVDTDNAEIEKGMNVNKKGNFNTKEKEDHKPVPVRNQTAPHASVFGLSMVFKISTTTIYYTFT